MTGWKNTTIGEQATLQRGFDITRVEQRDGQVPVISSSGVSSFHDSAMVQGPGVILGRKGVVGSVHFIDTDYWPHDTTLWVKDFHGNSPKFVYYFFRNIAPRLASLDVGSANPTLNRNHVHPIPVVWPSKKAQLAIATILGSLDDKIELNRRMNETLEAMARAIFKDWFVDFGPTRAKMEGRKPYLAPDLWSLFPDRLDDQGKPEGWEVDTLSGMAEQHTQTTSPSAHPDEQFAHFSIPAYDAGQTPSIDQGKKILSNKTAIPRDAILLSKLNPEIFRVWLPPTPHNERQICSTEFLVFTARKHVGRSHLYCLFGSDSFRAIIKGMATGTSKSHQRVNPKALADCSIVRPSREVAIAFEGLVGPKLEMSLQNKSENQTLASLRDLLLPKLMSGEIRIKDAEKMVGEAT